VVAIDARPEKLGTYRIRGKIGEGGMATVYVGKTEAGQAVALKVIKAEYAQNKEFLTMFLDEGKLASRLTHPNILRILELGADAGRLFMAMELLRGQSLYALWDATKRRNIRIPGDVLAYLGAEICAALHHAHDATDEDGKPLQIVHRDVNPSNVLVSYDGDVKVIDFGLAKAVNRASQTAAGIVKGKIAYLSPEQVSGKPLDRRADLFSLGTTLWEISLGRRLFKGETKVDTIHKIHRAEVPDPLTIDPTYPVLLWSVLRRCLMRLPAERFATAHECEVAFRDYITTESPGKDMKAALSALMGSAFADEQKKQEAWLDDAAHGTSAKPLLTLRPPSTLQAPPAFESLPLVTSNSSSSVGTSESVSLSSGNLDIDHSVVEAVEGGPTSGPPASRPIMSSTPPPLPPRASSSRRSGQGSQGPDGSPTSTAAPTLTRTSWLLPLGIVLAFLALLAAGAFLVQRSTSR
jgi:serine/threonine protein kinase